MAGLLKRLFKFGKKNEEDEISSEAETAAAEAAAAELEAQKLAVEQELLAAEQAVADAAAREAELKEEAAQEQRLAKEAAAQKAAEKEAAEAEASAEELRAREQMEREEAERVAAEEAAKKIEQERRVAAEEAAQEQERVAAEAATAQAALEKAKREEADALAAQATAKKEAADKAVAEAAQKAEQQRVAAGQAAVDQAAQEKAAQEEADRLAAEAAAQAEADKAAAEEARAQEQKEQEEADRLASQAAAQAEVDAAAAEEEEMQRVEQDRLAAEQTALEQERNEEAERLTAQPVEEAADGEPKKKKWFARLKDGLSRSSNQLTTNITAVFTKKKLDEDTLQDLEDILIQADLGIETAMNVTEKLAKQRMGKDVTDEEVREFMAEEIEAVLEPVAAELELDLDHTPHVILVVGVNGSGKTTTIGKLSQKLYDAGFSTLLVAGDTFRAAAIEQLKIWGDRTLSPVVSRPLGSDAAGLAYDAYELAKEEGRDVMLMDTAGRLQNKTELMDELEKIIRVLKKQDPEAPHTVLLTLDATTGQNALNQVDIFKEVSGVNGLVMTKLDGTARGGILVSISAKHKLPVYFLGVGESVDDLEPFEARDFARGIAGLS